MPAIKEIAGLHDAGKPVAACRKQDVTVTDSPPGIILALSGNSFPAALTPDEADLLAKQLKESARRVRRPGGKQ